MGPGPGKSWSRSSPAVVASRAAPLQNHLQTLHPTPSDGSNRESESSMVFSEPAFLFLFLPVALLCIAATLRCGRGTPLAILLLSLGFYYWSSGRLVFVLIGCALANWVLARVLERDRRVAWLILGLVANLGTLAVFKYTHFVASNWDHLLGSETASRWADLALPIGISFFTFQGVSYLIDVWRGDTAAEKNPLLFAAYLTFFPQLIAGPIVRFRDVAAQYRNPQANWDAASYGATRFAHGLLKKVVVADTVAPVADACFALSGGDLTFAAAWLGALAYAIQIYFDFSGYSDMAIGLAAMCGISLRENFDRPYSSASLTEFWRRWHISLSTWFRDYLYIPLGGNRTTSAGVYRNLAIVFIATGFWHGAAWNFLAWGLFHGSILMLERAFGDRNRLLEPSLTRRLLYALPLTLLGWVLFRSASLAAAFDYWRVMLWPAKAHALILPDLVIQALAPATTFVLLVASIVFFLPRDWTASRMLRHDSSGAAAVARLVYMVMGLLLCGMLVLSGAFSPFLYFRF